ncbi:MAG: hypothetical protein U5K79_04060 [Cyclobacteriaceae bacterium]|nr:hypothetical protein [Cyclobacteriaceae bacterium]
MLQYSLYSPHTIGKVGTIVTFDIQLNGFTDAISCQASINWDPALMKFSAVSDFGIQKIPHHEGFRYNQCG